MPSEGVVRVGTLPGDSQAETSGLLTGFHHIDAIGGF